MTAGKYYFAPDDAQHYPGFHNLGSRTWYDTNWENVVELGEPQDADAQWYPGTLPAQIPFPIVVGSTDCIRNGATGNGINFNQLDDGIPVLCYSPLGEENPLWFEVSSLYRCTLQLFYANVINWMYEDQAAWVEVVIRKWLGPSVVVTFHPAVGTSPAVTTVIHAQFSVAIVDGTRNFQQLALQAFQTIASPTDRGQFSTLPLWYAASEVVHTHLVADGAIALAPLMLVGHSYGGVACSILAARYRAATPQRTIRLMTFGMPKPGDDRLAKYLSLINAIHLVNDDDIVGAIAPNAEQLAPILTVIPFPVLTPWNLWVHPPAQVMLERDGTMNPRKDVILDFPTLILMAERAIAGEPQLLIPGHRIPEYIKRTAKRCPGYEWPIDFNAIPKPLIGWKEFPFPTRLSLTMASAPGNPSFPRCMLGLGQTVPAAKMAIALTAPRAGSSCPLAIDLAVDEPFAGTVDESAITMWFRIPVEEGHDYCVSFVTASFFDPAACTFHYGDDCESLNVVRNLHAGGDQESYVDAFYEGLFIFLEVGVSLPGSVPFTVQVSSGLCV